MKARASFRSQLVIGSVLWTFGLLFAISILAVHLLSRNPGPHFYVYQLFSSAHLGAVLAGAGLAMSAGVFVLQSADVKSVMQELERALGDRNNSPLSGILRVVPIERMNALLIITPQPAYLEEAKKWIARLCSKGIVSQFPIHPIMAAQVSIDG